MNKKTITILLIISLFIGFADFVTTFYGFSIGLVEADSLYFPFLSTTVLFGLGLFADYLYNRTNFSTDNSKKFFKGFSVFSVSFLAFTMVIPIINNMSLII
jgi:hypothetical protein